MIIASLSLMISAFFGILIIYAHPHIIAITNPRGDGLAVQSSHVGEPARVGGLAVLLSLMAVATIQAVFQETYQTPLLLLSVLPVFIAGLAEDLGHRVSPRGRFLAATVSAIAAVSLLGAWAPRSDIPYLDAAMSLPLVAIILTVLFSAGFCHAVNLIDGMNGLASTVVTISALGCAAISAQAEQPEITGFALLLAAGTIGFLPLNWPYARLFLGDAGAYGLGHLLVWLPFLLAWKTDTVAVPALMLVIFWPLADVLHTILRRLAERASILQPDKMHLHQKVRRMLDIIWFGYQGRQRSNPLTTLVLLPFITVPVVTGTLLWDQPTAAWCALGAFMLAFSLAHPLTVRLAHKLRK
jgi:UDP-GlcNAc:undecaprenyl-phosphate GlcNAc-1-phosphate transferase